MSVEFAPEVLADAIGVVVDLIAERKPGLDRSAITRVVEGIAGGRVKRRRLAQALLDRPRVLDDGRSPAPRAVGDLLVALNKAGVSRISAPVCAECGKNLLTLQRRGDDWYCGVCGPVRESCGQCGRIRPIHTRDRDGKPRCVACPADGGRDPLELAVEVIAAADAALSTDVAAAAVRLAAPRSGHRHQLAWDHGDTVGIRAAREAMTEASAECPGLFERAVQSAATTAFLAEGDATKAWDTSLAFERVEIVIPGVDELHNVWTAQAALAYGEQTVARRRADAAVSASNGPWLAIALSTRARVRVAQGDDDQAAQDAYDALMIANETGAHLATAETLECLARLAFDAESQVEATRLLGAADAHRQRLGLVRFKVFDDDHHALVSALRNALGDEGFDAAWNEGAALSTDDAIAYALRGRGERKRPSSGWGSLTRTELDVVRLVAEGIPNKDIAARLFVSPRTVQSHLRHVYNKLGLTSRVQLAQEAARH